MRCVQVHSAKFLVSVSSRQPSLDHAPKPSSRLWSQNAHSVAVPFSDASAVFQNRISTGSSSRVLASCPVKWTVMTPTLLPRTTLVLFVSSIYCDLLTKRLGELYTPTTSPSMPAMLSRSTRARAVPSGPCCSRLSEVTVTVIMLVVSSARGRRRKRKGSCVICWTIEAGLG